MSQIPLHDVVAQNRSIQAELDAAWQSVNQAGIFVNGPKVQQFESAFSNYIGADHCIGVGNATDGFEIAFQALNLNKGDEVIIPANAHVSPALAALKVGLKPVFCDVDEVRMLLSAQTASTQVSERTKAIVAVHLYGKVCPMEELQSFCSDHDLVLIEDFSQAHGASFNGQKVGSFGEVSVCSFYPTKPLGALGDGGAILTSNPAIAEKSRALARYGWNPRDNASTEGRNSRLDELQAAILNVKLNYLDKWNARRVELAKFFHNDHESGDICHLNVVRSEFRDQLIQFLAQNGVASQIHYPIPLHKQSLFKSIKTLPVSQKLADEILSVPLNNEVAELLRVFKVQKA
jgi:dTDP-4-amino-4,6-dideoxygalactose transaminase